MSFNPRINLNVFDRTVWRKRGDDNKTQNEWDTFVYGWAIEKGASVSEAQNFVKEVYENLV